MDIHRQKRWTDIQTDRKNGQTGRQTEKMDRQTEKMDRQTDRKDGQTADNKRQTRVLTECCILELPMPTLGDLSDLRKLTLRFRRQSHPTQLGYTYDELVGLDTLHLRIIPGKKGLIMKHVEFILESHVWNLYSVG